MNPANSKKKFGLILASARREQAAKGAGGIRKLNPLRDEDQDFNESSEDEGEDAMDWVQAALKKSGGGNSAQLAQQQRLMREALDEDASVFQYDELYDGMQNSRQEKQDDKKQQDKKPKYIHNILKTAEKRKLEKERRTERKVQAEREAEKGMFDDKESFVTTSYLNKLEELKKAEAQEKVDQMIEEKNDVAKHKNMGIFYNHLFKQRMGETTAVKTEETAPEASDVTMKKRDERSKGNHYRQRVDEDDDTHDNSSRQTRHDSSDSDEDSHRIKRKKKDRSQSPRSRRSESPKSIRKDSSRSKNLKSPSNTNETENPPCKKSKTVNKDIKDEPLSSDSEEDTTKTIKNNCKDKTKHVENESKESKESKEDRIRRLFSKRTIGEKFIEAQQRYFLRKSEREG